MVSCGFQNTLLTLRCHVPVAVRVAYQQVNLPQQLVIGFFRRFLPGLGFLRRQVCGGLRLFFGGTLCLFHWPLGLRSAGAGGQAHDHCPDQQKGHAPSSDFFHVAYLSSVFMGSSDQSAGADGRRRFLQRFPWNHIRIFRSFRRSRRCPQTCLPRRKTFQSSSVSG